MNAVEQGTRSSDFDRVRIAAHTLKSAMRTLGVDSARNLASELEASARRLDLKDTDQTVCELIARMSEIRSDVILFLEPED